MSNPDIHDVKDALRTPKWRGLIILLVIVLAVFILKPWVQVGAGERGIVQNFGAVQDNVLGEGIHFKIPFMQQVSLMDVKIQKAMTDAASSSSDLQDVDLAVALNYHVIPD